MTVPFTYRIIHNLTGDWYYGVHYAEGCHQDDLFKCYFTSSARISKPLAEDGPVAFKTEVRRTFQSKEEAIRWEHRVLRKILGWENCLNQRMPFLRFYQRQRKELFKL